MELPILQPEAQPERRVLDNGATLLSRPTPSTVGVALGLWVKSGTRHEPEGVGGISHLLEHMVFKGTRQRSAFQLAWDMEAIGAQLDAFTTKEYTAYTLRVLPEQLETALSILAEMLRDSTHPEDQLELEKRVVVEEILSSDDNPDDYVHERFMERLIPGHPLSLPILGSQESVMGIGRQRLAEHMAQVHRGANVIISAAGAVGRAEIDRIAGVFDFAPGSPEGLLGNSQPAPGPSPGSWVYAKDLQQQYVEIGVPCVGLDHPDRYALVILANLLGGGMSSRLFQKVREEEGLAYSIYSYTDFSADTGSFCTSLSASPDNAHRALEVIAGEYDRLRRGELDDDELEMNRAQVLSSMILGLEGSMGQMSRIARSEMYMGRFLPLEEMVAAIKAVDEAAIVRIAETYLAPEIQTVVGYGPAEARALSVG